MSTSAERALQEETDGLKASQDWLQTSNGPGSDTDEQLEVSENLTELKYRSVENVASAKLAKGLGIFSIALGLAEVLAAKQMASLIGLNDKYRRYLPLLGAREIAHGIGIMRSTKPTSAVWTRVGGDAVDLAFLGAAMAEEDSDKGRLGMAAAAVAGVAALDVLCAQKLSKPWSDADANPLAPTTVGQTSGRASMSA